MTDKRTILIVDSSLPDIQFIDRAINGEYDIISTTSGKKGVDIAQKEQPDLILMDVMMPDLDGYEMCCFLKKNPSTARIPIMIITELDHYEDEIIGLEAGAIDYITKPYPQACLKAKIRNHFLHRDLWRTSR